MGSFGRVCLAALLAALAATGAADHAAVASHALGASAFSIDMDPTGNTATSLGSRQTCARITANGVQDADEDATDAVDLDVTATAVPASAPMVGFEYVIIYDESNLTIQAYQGGFLLAANTGSNIFSASGDVPDVDGNNWWQSGEADLANGESVPETGSGILQRVTVGADTPSQTGVYDLALIGAGTIDDNNELNAPDTIENARLAINIACPPTDSDGDRVYDADESQCGSDPYNAALRPERIDGPFAGVSDDGDAQVDEALPANIPMADCDGDGFSGSAEDHVYAPGTQGDQDPCGSAPSAAPFNVPIGWPGDLNGVGTSANKITLADATTFTVPVRRLDTSPGDPNYNVRWDIVPGNSGQAKDINSADMNFVTTFTAPMFFGARAFGGPPCAWPP